MTCMSGSRSRSGSFFKDAGIFVPFELFQVDI
ncbi:hypothetical protein X737_39820 [Mesorhizobium sp. L48C026A00]|nr:hypothetical protein X737_39820 [Mesorhizobium sp. L48C026A00]